MKNIWQELREKGPIMALAPMADVTDAAFRQIINKYGKPDLFYTEFVSADGLCNDLGRQKLMRELYFTPDEQPIIAQLFSSKPENMEQAARLCAELGFAGIDINMGCPDKTIEKQGCGSAMIKNPKLAQEIIFAAKRGVTSAAREFSRSSDLLASLGQTVENSLAASPIPVSVKTRVGYNKVELETWAKTLLEAEPASITFHLRTRKEMSKVPANWDLITIPRDMAKGTGVLILGNGDVKDLADAKAKVEKYKIDGVMIGRAIFGNPWLFAEGEAANDLARSGRGNPRRSEDLVNRLTVTLEHTKLFEELFRPGEKNTELFGGHTKSFAIMKKHFKAYVNGFDGANELRAKLMETENASEVENLINDFLKK